MPKKRSNKGKKAAEKKAASPPAKAKSPPAKSAPSSGGKSRSRGRRRSTHLTEDEHDQLDKKLQNRPEHNSAHIQQVKPHNDVAPALASAKRKLEQSIVRDNVGHLLESRPDLEDLKTAGVVGVQNVSARIAGTQKKLQHSMTTDKVGHLLEQRAEWEDLAQRDIVKDSLAVAPAIQPVQQVLKKNLAKSNLYHALSHRPSLVELAERGVYVPNEEDWDDIYAAESYLARDSDSEEDDDDDYDEYGQSIGDYGDPIGVPDYNGDEDEGDEPAFVDQDGNPHYYDADGNLYLVAEDGNAYYVDEDEYETEDVEPYYIDQDGNPYFLDDQGKPYVVAEDGQAYYVEMEEPDSPGDMAQADYDAQYDDFGDEYGEYGDEAVVYPEDEFYEEPAEVSHTSMANDRSRSFTLTRLLLKTVSMMSRAGEVSDEHKGLIKDLIVDQDEVILSVAESYLENEDLGELKESLLSLVM